MYYLLALPTVIFLFQNIIYILVFILARKNKNIKTDIPVSILVSCRNEERDLPDCLNSIKQLNYPPELMEVILVDDLSTDSTSQIIEQVCRDDPRFKSISSHDYQGPLKAKARGIHTGMSMVSNEWVFITDADARVPEGWISHMLAGIDDKVGVITGTLNVDKLSGLSVIEKMNYCYQLPVLFGYSYLLNPPIALGPNMVIRKSIYEQEGGLENIRFNVAEDLALYRLMKRGGKSAKAKGFPETTVDIVPVPSTKHVFSQQNRWVAGSREHKDFLPVLLLWLGQAALHSIMLILVWFVNIELAIFMWILKIIVDSLHYMAFRFKLKRKRILRMMPVVWFFNIFFIIAGFITIAFGSKVEWRGEGYVETYQK